MQLKDLLASRSERESVCILSHPGLEALGLAMVFGRSDHKGPMLYPKFSAGFIYTGYGCDLIRATPGETSVVIQSCLVCHRFCPSAEDLSRSDWYDTGIEIVFGDPLD